MNKTDYPLPLIHINGTGKKMLQEGYSDAAEIAANLRTAFCDIEFHARDYYVISDAAFTAARNKRAEIRAKIEEIQEYLGEHCEHLYE